ncbi:violacein biosynthesis enzyme VioE [Janthinobacterium sp. GW458P]|uniref:violacein biosynthesis enzyme VioE n=1 Tax=Janthinobacterium sp. GW458P TaxID=1981504 RepID=UPI000A322D5C|nr:violacein biosynthesis enzyme VioE [Janthinobacterium sp. GW458P]MBE3024729.1 violacein biosynthesis enzyme VioE [Janthinobacterium sp. GW458P]PHV17965.1 violacein biosynthesis enzyme VioE [Janthinobacterium sp. BJB303]
MPAHLAPPLLPLQWSSAYVSYWTPMQEDDQVTSGYCWFDYARNICRIDGLFNPWSEKEHGHLLWMSEIGDARRKQSRKQKVAYARQAEATGAQLQGMALADEVTPFHDLFLPQAVLPDAGARHDGRHTVLGQEADAWIVERMGKPPSVFYLEAGGNRLLRMVTGNDPQHLSVRDFPNLQVGGIPDSVFTSCNM